MTTDLLNLKRFWIETCFLKISSQKNCTVAAFRTWNKRMIQLPFRVILLPYILKVDYISSKRFYKFQTQNSLVPKVKEQGRRKLIFKDMELNLMTTPLILSKIFFQRELIRFCSLLLTKFDNQYIDHQNIKKAHRKKRGLLSKFLMCD